jgi:hypothetical protein
MAMVPVAWKREVELKTRIMKTKFFAALLIVPLLFTASCKKTDSPGGGMSTGHMSMRMMDAPAPYGVEEVNLDVRSVEVHFANGTWEALQVSPRVINVLSLTNGTDVLIADEDLPAGQITGVRLILGPNNSMRRSGTNYPLAVPSGEESGLKVDIRENVGTLPLNLFLDFDAGQSIVQEGNGSYHLKPVIHVFTTAETGTIAGILSIPGPGKAITLTSTAMVTSTYAEPVSGQFKVRGLTPGVYSATVSTATGEILFTNITVTAGQTTDMGTLNITR